MLAGRKRWTLFSEEDGLRLGRNYFTASFQVNSSAFKRNGGSDGDDTGRDGESVCIDAAMVKARLIDYSIHN